MWLRATSSAVSLSDFCSVPDKGSGFVERSVVGQPDLGNQSECVELCLLERRMILEIFLKERFVCFVYSSIYMIYSHVYLYYTLGCNFMSYVVHLVPSLVTGSILKFLYLLDIFCPLIFEHFPCFMMLPDFPSSYIFLKLVPEPLKPWFLLLENSNEKPRSGPWDVFIAIRQQLLWGFLSRQG